MGSDSTARSQIYPTQGTLFPLFSLTTPHTSTQTAEIIALLYESTQTPLASSSSLSSSLATVGTNTTEPLNPTVGVRPRGKFPEALRGLMFRKDPSQPGGGVFVAAERPGGDYSDLPRGTIVLRGDGIGSKDGNPVHGEGIEVSPM